MMKPSEAENGEEDLSARILLVSAFDSFVARPLGQYGRITRGLLDPEREAIENELRGKTWHNLISYHHQWDPSLTNLAFITLETFVELLPSYICATVLWSGEIDYDPLLRRLLAPLFPDQLYYHEFNQLAGLMSPEQRNVVRRFLTYMLRCKQEELEVTWGRDEKTIASAIDESWAPVRKV